MFNNTDLKTEYNKIVSLIDRTTLLDPDNEIKSDLAKYLCIQCSGLIENAIYYILSDKISTENQHNESVTFIKKKLLYETNLNSYKIATLLGIFNIQWKESYESFITEENRKAAIDYVIKERNNIAHGKNSNVTLANITTYFLKIKDVLLFLQDELKLKNQP